MAELKDEEVKKTEPQPPVKSEEPLGFSFFTRHRWPISEPLIRTSPNATPEVWAWHDPM